MALRLRPVFLKAVFLGNSKYLFQFFKHFFAMFYHHNMNIFNSKVKADL